MSLLTSMTPFMLGEGGAIVQSVPQLPEAVVEVTDLEEDYVGQWLRVAWEVQGINRMDEGARVATARVHAVVGDRLVRKLGIGAFSGCGTLVKVMAPFVEEVEVCAFREAFYLRHLTISPDIVVKPKVFIFCLSLEVLAISVGFELDTRNKDGYGRNDATIGITRFAK